MSGDNSVMLCFFFWRNFNKSLWKNIFLVSSHSNTSTLVRAPPQLTLYPSPTTCAVDNFQRLRFGNSQSPDKFTGKPKIVSHPTSSQESVKKINVYIYIAHHLQGKLHSPISRKVFPCHHNDAIVAALLQHNEDNFSKLTDENRSKIDRNKYVPNKW